MISKITNKYKTTSAGFTLIEIIVVISVVGLLSVISVVSYGNWRQRITAAQAKNDLMNIAAAFDNYKTFNNTFPADITKLSNFEQSEGISITGGSTSGNYFCVNANSVTDVSIKYYISSVKKEVLPGSCPAHYWKIVSVGNSHTCAISIDDELYCWGDNYFGQLGNNTVVTSFSPKPVLKGAMPSLKVKSVSSGFYYTCAINFDDQVYCWGSGSSGQLGRGSTTSSSTPVAVSIGAMASLSVKTISVGDHACVLGMDDKAYCWGANGYGQLGDNTTTQRNSPVLVSQGVMPSLNVKSISVGYQSSCAIGINDNAYCWGAGSSGKLGNGSTANSSIAVAVSQGAMPSLNIKTIKLSRIVDNSIGSITCAINFDNRAYCWGFSYGLGNGSGSNSSVPVAVSQGAMPSLNLADISVANRNVCAINGNKRLYCWGDGTEGQLGNDISSVVLTPAEVVAGEMNNRDVKFFDSSCAINMGDDMYCFGTNNFGKIGNGFSYGYTTPVQSKQGSRPLLATKQISSGGYHTCLIDNYDKPFCFGNNYSGRLGNGLGVNSSDPVAVAQGAMPSLNMKYISAGGSFTCGLNANDRVYCWGYNNYSQLGDDSFTSRSTPVSVVLGAMPSLNVKNVSSGDTHVCVINFDDKAYCWGSGSDGQLGNGLSTLSDTPVAVSQGAMPSLFIKSISAGRDYTCAVNFDDKVYCWGSGSMGQLGNGLNTGSSVPVAVLQGAMLSTSVKMLEVGNNTACAVGFNNNIYCWGNNQERQIINNATANILTPTARTQGAMPSLEVSNISVGSLFVCAVNSTDGAVYCWGDGRNGQIGNGVSSNSVLPSKVSLGAGSSLAVKSLSSGSDHNCIIDSFDKVYCWGYNKDGQLGEFERTNKSTGVPRLVLPPI